MLPLRNPAFATTEGVRLGTAAITDAEPLKLSAEAAGVWLENRLFAHGRTDALRRAFHRGSTLSLTQVFVEYFESFVWNSNDC